MIRHTSRLLLRLAAAALTALLMAVGAAAFVLSKGPVSLGFLRPYALDMLNDPDAAVQVDVTDTVLAWEGWDRRLDVRLVGLSLRGPDGRLIAELPSAAVALNGLDLLRGRLEPRTVDLIEPRLWLVRGADGELRLAAGLGGQGDADIFGILSGESSPAFVQSLETVRVLGASLAIVDESSDAQLTASRVDLTLTRLDDGLSGEASGRIELAGEAVALRAVARYPARAASWSASLTVAGLRPLALAEAFPIPELAPLRRFDLALSGVLRFDMSGENRLSAIAFDLSGAPGRIAVGEVYEEPLALERLSLRGDWREAERVLRVERLEGRIEQGPVLMLSGEAAFVPGGPALRGEAHFERLAVDDLARYWPATVAPREREWVTSRMSGGTVSEATARFDVPAGALDGSVPLSADAAVLEFAFEGVRAAYWSALPPLAAAEGRGRLTPHEFDLTLTSGRTEGLEVPEGRVHIARLNERNQVADISFLARGGVREALRLLDRPRLRLASELGLSADEAGGRTAVRARFLVPLKTEIGLADVGYSASARITELALPELFEGYALSQGELLLTVDSGGLDAKGEVRLNGVPVALNWRRDFAGGDEMPDRYGLAMTLDDAQRRALRLDTGGYLAGPVSLSVQLASGREGRLRAQGHARLRTAAISLPELRWRKETGQPAGLDFAVRRGAGGPLTVERFGFEGGGLAAQGSAVLDDSGLRRLTLQRLQLGETDLSAELATDADGGRSLALNGKSLDLRPFLAEEEPDGATAPADETAPLALSATLDRIVLNDRISLVGAQADGRLSGPLGFEGAASGYLSPREAAGAGAPVTVEIRQYGSHAGLELRSRDAGGVLRAFGILKNGQGGRFQLEARVPNDPGEPTTGRLRAEEFVVTETPVLAEILKLGSLSGIVELISGEQGLSFSRLDAPFVATENSIIIENARAVGSAMGLTLSGEIERRTERLNLSGTLVPAYTLNSVLGYIPLIGDLLVGREGEGVFALSYRINGSQDNPRISVNPLSALAPGFLRRIVEGLDAPAGPPGPDSPERRRN